MSHATIFIIAALGALCITLLIRFRCREIIRKHTIGEERALKKARGKRTSKKEENKQKVLALAQKKKRIRNNDVEKLLKVSDATATRYLRELAKERKIKQVKKGNKTYYETA